MINQGSLNSVEFSSMGLVVSSGLKSLEAIPLPKPIEPYDWPEFAGLEYSTATPVMQDHDVTLECYILAASMADAISFKALLSQELFKAGVQQLYVKSLDQTFSVRYKGSSGFEWITKTQAGKQGMKFNLTLTKVWDEFEQTITTILDGNGE